MSIEIEFIDAIVQHSAIVMLINLNILLTISLFCSPPPHIFFHLVCFILFLLFSFIYQLLFSFLCYQFPLLLNHIKKKVLIVVNVVCKLWIPFKEKTSWNNCNRVLVIHRRGRVMADYKNRQKVCLVHYN